ncbi:hypothetical protein [Sphingomonas sp. Leaf4]|uniref:hypothetical protein n=1 Tax=Sphingomonas sp. Leaf4 TaxID=2876553 RepID=UPI001E6428DA|nr:hypothetical protein [Sphingomonas sp. Leaf4]
MELILFPANEADFAIVDLSMDEIDATVGGMRFGALIWRGLDYAGRIFTAAQIADMTSVDLEEFGRCDARMARPGGGI